MFFPVFLGSGFCFRWTQWALENHLPRSGWYDDSPKKNRTWCEIYELWLIGPMISTWIQQQRNTTNPTVKSVNIHFGNQQKLLGGDTFPELKGLSFLNLKHRKNKCMGNFWSEVINPWHSTKISLGFFPAEVFHACLTQKSFAPQKNFRIFNPSCRCKFSVAACRQPIPTRLLIQNTKAYYRFLLHHPKKPIVSSFHLLKKGFTWNRRVATIVFLASTNVLVEFFFSVLRDEGFQTVHIIELDTSEIMSALGGVVQLGSDVKFWRRHIVSLHGHLIDKSHYSIRSAI